MKRRALTLVELLVVIGVITLLIAFLLPALSNARKHARTVTCLSNLRTLQLSFVNYFVNVNDSQSFHGGNGGIVANFAQDLWMDDLIRAGTTPVIRFCPEAMELAPLGAGNLLQAGTAHTAWTWVNYRTNVQLSGSYAFNGWLYGDLWRADQPAVILPRMWKDDVPVFCDSMWVDASPSSTDSPPVDLYLGASGPYDMERICLDRHHMAINVAFLGGTVQTVKLEDLWTLRWNNGFTPPMPLPAISPAE
jgi:type II secretory pathway pseudopilin PulG